MEKVLGIFRSACYSPGMVERDEAILRAVAKRLKEVGYIVELIHEEDFCANIPMPNAVLHMARSSQALEILQTWQESGCRVINTAKSVRCVERAALAKLCTKQGIPTPQTWIVNTAQNDPKTAKTTSGTIVPITFPCWIKRTGTCSQKNEDVCLVNDSETYKQCLAQFRVRGISTAVVMEHLKGPCIKFYAVKGTDFFYSLPAYDKWADLTSSSSPIPNKSEDPESCIAIRHSIQPLIEQSDDTPVIYGGDAIIGSNGVAYLIDLNDWPSFSACREEAADAIARMIIKG